MWWVLYNLLIIVKFKHFSEQFTSLMKLALSGVKSLKKKRQYGGRIWLLSFVFTLTIQTIVESGNGVVKLMFYKIQYNVEMSDLSYLMMMYSLLTIISQLVILPVLSGRLGIRDTSIIIFAMLTNILGHLIFAISYNLPFLIVAYIIWAFYANIATTSRSCLTKIVDHIEVGSVLGIVSIFQSLVPIASKPLYGFLYKNTLEVFPAAYLFVSMFLLTISLITMIGTHVSMSRREKELKRQDNMEN